MAKRTNGEGTIRKRNDGRWEARYFDPIDGRQHSIYGKTQKAVSEKLRLTLCKIDEHRDIENVDILVTEWIDTWLKNYTSNIKPSTLATYKGTIETHLRHTIGVKALRKLTANDIQRVYTGMQAQGLSPKTIKNTHGVIHKILDQAIKLRYLKYNVSEACVIPKVEQKEISPMDEEEIAEFLTAIKGDMYESVYFVTLFTGMRQSEVLGLTWDCIDFENNTIYLNKQLVRDRNNYKEFYFSSLKNGKSRTIYISRSIAEVLKQRKTEQEKARKSAGRNWVGRNTEWSNLVFTDEYGMHLNHTNVYKHYKRIVKRIGIGEKRFHDLRHSYAVLALQNGDDIKTVQEALGHHTSGFTLQVYAHSTNLMKKESANRMDKYIRSLG